MKEKIKEIIAILSSSPRLLFSGVTNIKGQSTGIRPIKKKQERRVKKKKVHDSVSFE